mgnify:CR=1 FL=1
MGGVDFRKRILSVLRTTKKEKKKRKKESDLPSRPSPLHEAKEEEEERRRRVRLRRQQEQQEQQQPSHFVQYASPKTLQPVVLPRLKSSSFEEEDKEEEEEKNEYVQKPVLSESQLRNIYSSNENKSDGYYTAGHLREEDALNDILTTPIVGR